MQITPPTQTAYRVETSRLVLRCWSPADSRALRECLDRNNQHLRPWIPFMKDEPRSLQQTTEWLRGIRAAFDLRQNFRYGVFDPEGEKLLGENMLLTRAGPGAFEIGYWTDVDAIGQGIACETTSALIRVAFEIEEAERVEIMCSPENEASAAIPAKLGFSHDATLPKRAKDTEGNTCDLMVWSLFARDYPSSPAIKTKMQVFDCLNDPVALKNDSEI